MYFAIIVFGLLAAIIVAGIVRAQIPERLAIVTFVAASALSWLVTPSYRSLVPQVLYSLALVDIAVIVALVWIGHRFGRTWPLIAAALQIVSTLAHLARIVDPTFDLDAYAMMESASAMPQLILLAIAIWRHPQKITAT